MIQINYKNRLFLWSLSGAAALSLNLVFFHNPILGLFGLLLYIIPLGRWCGGALGFINLLSAIIILTTGSYYVYGITKPIALIILFLPLFCFLFKLNKTEPILTKNATEKIKLFSKQFYLLLIFILLEATLLGALIFNKTAELMPSPWAAVHSWFFILYGATTGLLFYLSATTITSLKTQMIIVSAHLFITFAVTPILYPLGWGFDAFVHRATETWILNNGFITPKQPYYIGQYSLVVWLAHLTAIPIFYIDVYLTPLLASLALPAGLFFSLKKTFNIPAKFASLFIWLIPFIPFLSLHLTTPHNLVLLFSILLVFIVLTFLKTNLPPTTLILLSAATVLTHPLVGVPIFIFTMTAIIIKKYQNNKKIVFISLFFSLLLLIVALPLMFLINNLRVGAGWPEFFNPFLRLDYFFQLFSRPYWYAKNTPLIFEMLYAWQLMIAPTAVTIGLIGFLLYWRKHKNILFTLYPVSLIGFILSAWLLRSWITFPNVVSYEQGDFPLRLVKASILFLLPFAAYALFLLLTYLSERGKKIILSIILILSSILLMLSFYLSYPQRNIKARFPGLNVTAADFKTVEWIHNQHQNYDYIVLSNQLVSAAALTNYSFAKYFNTAQGEIFYYSLPTGGLLYQQYGKMLYEGQKREYMTDAMDMAGVNTAYFVLNSYWANADNIAAGAKKTANSWLSMDNGKVLIFKYNK